MSICRDSDISKTFMYKRWSKVMHGVSIFNLTACLQMYCSTEYIAVGFDVLRSTTGEVLWEIFLNMFQWLLIVYNQTNLVNGYEKNKHNAIISRGLTHFCFQESIINHSLSFGADKAETTVQLVFLYL